MQIRIDHPQDEGLKSCESQIPPHMAGLVMKCVGESTG